MHIALFSRAWPMGFIPSGIVTYVSCLRAALLVHGHEVSVFAEEIDPENSDDNVYPVRNSLSRRLRGRFLKLTGRPRDDVFTWGEAIAESMLAVHRRTPIDVVEMEESFGWCSDVQRDLGVPVVAKLHGPAFLTATGREAESKLSIRRVHHEGYALRKIAAVVSPSQCTLDAAVKRYRHLPEVTDHVPNPVPQVDDTPQWCASRCERHLILFVGRFDHVKGGDLVIRAFAQILDQFPDAKLIFVGPDPGLLDDTGVERHIDEFAQAVLGSERLASMSYLGKRDAAEIGVLRARAQTTVVASRWENQCYTALEAMAQGCPVVGTNSGGTLEIIEHGVTGLLCRADDAGDLSRAISSLLGNLDLCERLGERARRWVRSAHAPDVLAERSVAVYKRAIVAYRRNDCRD